MGVPGVVDHSATVIMSGLVQLPHHSFRVDLDLLKHLLTVGCVVVAGMFLMELVDKVLRPLIVVQVAADKAALAAAVLSKLLTSDRRIRGKWLLTKVTKKLAPMAL
jgi:hypothetical protein